jgi:hypothetical protein
MSGTRPTFYLVPVSMDLSDAVQMGQYPLKETEVFKCVTVLLGHNHRISEDMCDTTYRKLALQRFLAFKTLAESHWTKFL